MTTPDDTRALAEKVLASLDDSDGHTIDVHSAAVVAARCLTLLAEIERLRTDAAAALRDSGWVDPGGAEQLRLELAEALADLRKAREKNERLQAQRDALLPVVEAAKVRAQVVRDLHYSGSGAPGWTDRDRESDAAVLAAVDALESQEPTVHDYLSTACLHGVHGYCGGDERIDGGKKTPAVCKFHDMPGWTCTPCRCGCHAESREGDAVRTMHIPGDSIKRATEAAIDAELARRESREESTDG